MVRLSVFGLVVVAACKEPDPTEVVQPLESTLGAAVPAAYFSAVTMAALDGRVSPCTNVVTPGGGGEIRVEVSLGGSCPPMFGHAGEAGTMVVTGTWTPTFATFAMDFTSINAGGTGFLVAGIGIMTVTVSGTRLLIAYGEEAVMIASGQRVGAGIDQIAWVVDVDTRATDTPSDDSIAISGGDQSLLAANGGGDPEADVTQVAVGNAVFNAGCRKNPNAGLAAVQRAGTRGGGWILYSFHSTCDGTTDVVGAMAPYELMLGDKVPLEFLQQ